MKNETKKEQKTFDDFTNLYELNKTLRFSLVPVLTKKQEEEIISKKKYNGVSEIRRQDREEKFFNENKRDVFEIDIERKKQYRKLKYYLTELHKLFIKDSLKKIKDKNEIDFSKLFDDFIQFEKIKDDNEKANYAKKINDEKIKLAKFFGDQDGTGGIFQETAKEYYDFLESKLEKDKKEKILDNTDKKQRKNNILLSQNVLLLLGKKIKNGSIKEKTKKSKDGKEIVDQEYALNFNSLNGKTNLIDYFSGWSTYFKNFNEIRGNLYKDDGRKGEVESSEKNMVQKANAGQITTRIIDENFEIFVKNFILANRNKSVLKLDDFGDKDILKGVSIFDAKFYVNCFLQEDIAKYNAQIGKLNKFFNENKKNKKDKIKYLNTLHKQLLLTDKADEEDIYIEEFIDDNDFIKGLDDFKICSQEKINLIKDFSFLDKTSEILDEIVLSENQTHFFCNQFFGSWSYFRDLYYQKNEIDKKNQNTNKKDFKDKDGLEIREISLSEIKELLEFKDKKEFKEDIQKGNFLGVSEDKKIIYQEELSNFEHFILFLQYYFDSLVNGRSLLTRKENKDIGEFRRIKASIDKAKENGEKVDDLLLKKVSEESFRQDINKSVDDKVKDFEKVFNEFQKSVDTNKKFNREKDFEFKKSVSEYCNRISEINRFFALFSMPEGVADNTLNRKIEKFKDGNRIIPLYSEIRNFITKRGDELEKVKLNFDNQVLMDGWDLTKEESNTAAILKNNKKYFLCIFCKDKKIFNKEVHKEIFVKDSDWKKMEYKQMKDASQSIPKCSTQTKEVKSHFAQSSENFYKREDSKGNKFIKPLKITKDIFELNNFEYEIDYLKNTKDNNQKLDISKRLKANSKNNKQIKLFQKKFYEITSDYDTYKKSLNVWIDFCKDFLECYPSSSFFDFSKFSKTEEYNSIDEFYKDVDRASYNIKFVDIDDMYLKEKIENNQIYLFQIYNKDFSKHKKEGSSENLHTIYFKELFSGKNLKEPVFKLSGGAEIFFREKVKDYKIEIQDILKNPKTDKKPNKKRRFAENKILFHLPIVLNNINKGEKTVNKKINDYIQQNEDVKILGIDRGEKELAYYCLLNKKGEICRDLRTMNEAGSNIIKKQDGIEEKQIVNYHSKLDIKEKERMMARKSWTKIEGIKDLKKGYISNIVKDITGLMIDNNAFVCLEELNYGFKRGRIKIEKSVYQHLENALVDKLNYLVLEKSSEGVRGALQLTPPNRAQKYWGNQMGAIFYTDAKFTSRTCPNCGFRKRGINGFDQVKSLKEKIENDDLRIFFEEEKDRFRIEYNWQYKFNENKKEKEFTNYDLYGKNKMEIIYSDVIRNMWDSGRYINRVRKPNEELKELFEKYLTNNGNLFDLAQDEKQFSYSYFIQIFKSIIEIRNIFEGNSEEKSKDIISCPKCHFSTETANKIKNGDANGAYNIARKGLLVFEKIRSDKMLKKNQTKKGIESKDLKIALIEWDKATYEQWDKKDWGNSSNLREL